MSSCLGNDLNVVFEKVRWVSPTPRIEVGVRTRLATRVGASARGWPRERMVGLDALALGAVHQSIVERATLARRSARGLPCDQRTVAGILSPTRALTTDRSTCRSGSVGRSGQ